jgi:hypothetical protein
VERVAVGRGIDGDGFDVELAARANDPHGHLTAICDQDPVEHALVTLS